MTFYRVNLLDKDGLEIATDERETLAEAKQRAKYLLSDTYAANNETAHESLGTHKAEILRNGQECVWDGFRNTSSGQLAALPKRAAAKKRGR
jgi:vacuolar-type H+-ATPase subunit H